jgi:hypothetical protein
MTQHSGELGATRNRTIVVTCLLVSSGLAAGAAITGIADNPAGVLLIWSAVAGFMVALVHHWRRSKPFYLFLGGSFLAFVASAVLHNLFWALGQANPDLPSWVLLSLEAIHVSAFLVAVIVCPPAILIGLVGWVACVTGGALRKLSSRHVAG